MAFLIVIRDCMLTCLAANTAAMSFYKNTLKYASSSSQTDHITDIFLQIPSR